MYGDDDFNNTSQRRAAIRRPSSQAASNIPNCDDENSVVRRGCSPESLENQLFERFEVAATSVTKLFSDADWPAFQQAAAAVTLLYKDNVDIYRRGFDAGMSVGRQKICKELVAALQSGKIGTGHHNPYVRRDDCINLVLGLLAVSQRGSSPQGLATYVERSPIRQMTFRKSTPPHQDTGNRTMSVSPPRLTNAVSNGNQDLVDSSTSGLGIAPPIELSIFCEALNSPSASLNAFLNEECCRHLNNGRPNFKRRRGEDDEYCNNGGSWPWRKKGRRC